MLTLAQDQNFTYSSGPVFTKLFRIWIKSRLKLKIVLLWNFLKPSNIIY